MRLIDAEAFKAYMRGALEQTRRCYPDGGEWAEAVTEEFCRDIDAQPTVEPERKQGKWKSIGWSGRIHKCNQCGNMLDFGGVNAGRGDANFCPNCGADMRGEQDETD